MKNQISKQTWQELFSLALQFKGLSPWNWMNDTDFFAVQIPDSSVKYYCTIMGGAGEVFALGMYAGTEGLDTLADLAEFGEQDPFEMIASQRCLMFSLCDKDELMEEDLEIIKKAGVTFKGKNAFPTFHDYTPSYLPYPISTEDQAKIMMTVLAQALVVAAECKKNPMYLVNPDSEELGEHFLVRVRNEAGDWESQWLEPDDYVSEEEEESVSVNTLYLNSNLGKLSKNASKTWIMDVFLFPTPVQDSEGTRPYFPKVMMIVDAESGMVIAHEPFMAATFGTEFQQTFVKVCKTNEHLPSKILYGNPDMEDYLPRLGEALGIEIEEDDQVVEFFEMLKEDLYESMDDSDLLDDYSKN